MKYPDAEATKGFIGKEVSESSNWDGHPANERRKNVSHRIHCSKRSIIFVKKKNVYCHLIYLLVNNVCYFLYV